MRLAVLGLGRMGANIGLRLMKGGHEVIAFDRDAAAVKKSAEAGATAAGSLEEAVKAFPQGEPRIFWVMLPAGPPTEDTINALVDLCSDGDVIIDGGNTFYKDDIRRAESCKLKNIHYVDVGTSGGVWGLERGYCMMIGGPDEAVRMLDPIFDCLAPGFGEIPRTKGRESRKDDRAERGYIHAGPAGAGHFVKMVHNGIEYGLMQAYAEGFDILKGKASDKLAENQRFDIDLTDVAEVWRRGSVISSWLLDLSANALVGDGNLDKFKGKVADSGEGQWTIDAAMEEAVPANVLTAALFARYRSRVDTTFGDKMLSAMRFGFGGHVEMPSEQDAPVSEAKPAPEATFVVFGALGDLTKRLLAPALVNLMGDGLIPDTTDILGVSHHGVGEDDIRKTLGEFVDDKVAYAKLSDRITYLEGEFEDEALYKALVKKKLKNAVFYLATAPGFFGTIVDRLGKAGLFDETDGFRRVVIEKPFGSDLPSAQALNTLILSRAREEQIYRIDHFLGKETVQNIMVFRFGNPAMEAVWNSRYIDHVQITAAESVGVGTRGKFYDATGALRDMVPNHLFQVLSMIGMEPPNSFDADAIRTEKAKVIAAVKTVGRDDAARGRYETGTVGGAAVAPYVETPEVDPKSTTETYAALKVEVQSWRWSGTPFYLRTGKALSARDTEVVIQFRDVALALLKDADMDRLPPNRLVIQIQPDEGISLEVVAKTPGPGLEAAPVSMEFKYADRFEIGHRTGYETLLYDVLVGDQTLFQRADQIESGWRAVQPLLEAWGRSGAPEGYAAGTAGPGCAEALLIRDGRRWHKLG